MAHHTARSEYAKLVERLNKMPQGAPPSKLLYKILEMLVSPREASLLARTPLRPFTTKRAARVWKVSLAEAEKTLEQLAGRALLVDFELWGKKHYVLPPPMAGFFEFSMMRVRDDIDQHQLSELFYQYVTVEEEFMRALCLTGETRPVRTYVHEPALSADNMLHILDFELASNVAKHASAIAVGMCYCRHKMQHLDKACDAPMDICLTFNDVASSLIRHGTARAIEAAECLDLLRSAGEQHLVQIGENSRRAVTFICNCCGCCCDALIAQQRFGSLRPIHTTNYLPVFSVSEGCRGCGKCAKRCPVDAIVMKASAKSNGRPAKAPELDETLCLGCGLCVNACRHDNIALQVREERIIPPLSPVVRTVLMAIERNKLQELILDNNLLLNHRAVGALLSAILSLPPIKRTLANQQLSSRFIEKMIR